MDAVDQRIPERLPLIDALIEERTSGEPPLVNTVAVLIQHQLGSIVPMVRALLELGLDPASVYWVDIPYSANTTVAEHLVGLGIPAANFAPADYHLDQPFLRYQLRRVARVISTLDSAVGPGQRVLVLDDGAYFLEAASYFSRRPPQLALVEQTRRGMLKLRVNSAMQRYAESVPLVNVAEAPPKRLIEARFLARTIGNALASTLVRRGLDASRPRTLLLGYGAIGEALATVLIGELGWSPEQIHVFDPAQEARARADAVGLPGWDRDDPERRRFGLVIGCTGTSSFGVGDWVHLEDGAVLASASSGSAELSRELFIEMADLHEDDDVYLEDRASLPSRPIHSEIEVHVVDRTIVFLNGGFPVDFDGRINNTPPQLIQLTRAMMVAGALQAMHSDHRGVTPLDPGFCDWVTRRFLELQGGNGAG